VKKIPNVSVDILIVRDGKILLGLLTDQWKYKGQKVYGVPGRDILFGEKIGQTVSRNIREEFGCNVTHHKIFAVNANYALGNHFIGIGVMAEIDGEPKVLLPEDWEKWGWFDKDHLPSNLFPAAQNLVDSYLQSKVSVAE
jgi:ADP-ribose pyrophosphatase YjhB (NUDIX family)